MSAAGSSRLLLLAAALAAGCAGSRPQPDAIAGLRDEVRSLRRAREEDRRKLDAIEAQLAAMQRRAAAPVATKPAAQLEVVKLSPPPPPPPPPEKTVEEPEGDSFIFIADRGDGEEPSVPSATAAPLLPTDVELKEPADPASFDNGVAALRRGDAATATLALERFIASHPRDARADNAWLALGDAFRKSQQPGRALAAYERAATDYPAGDARPEALLRYGETCMKLGRAAAARAAFVRLVEDHPHTEAAVRAGKYLADRLSRSL